MTNTQIITTAACHFCCAPIGQPCVWAPCDDPDHEKNGGGDSHNVRTALAQKRLARSTKIA